MSDVDMEVEEATTMAIEEEDVNVSSPATSTASTSSSSVSHSGKTKVSSSRGRQQRKSTRGGRAVPNSMVRDNLSTLKKKQIKGGGAVTPLRSIKIGSINYWENDTLGQGGTAVVYSGYFEVPQTQAAVKMIPKKFCKYYESEIKVLRWIISREEDKAHLVKYFATEEDEKNYFIAMQRAQYTLGELINNPTINENNNGDGEGGRQFPKLTKLEIVSILKQAGLGLQAMHCYKRNTPIVHRDVKPANILLFFSEDETDHHRQITAKLSDFGISKELSMKLESTTTRPEGTQDWMSPECLRALEQQEKDKSIKVEYKATLQEDIFCFGMVIYWAMNDGEHPFGPRSMRMINMILGNTDAYVKKAMIDQRAMCVTNLVYSMLSQEDRDRPSIQTVLCHPFFWSDEHKHDFVTAVVNCLERDEKIKKSDDDRICNSQKYEKPAGGWIQMLDKPLLQDLILKRERECPRAKRYIGSSDRSLLEFIRDKYQHKNEWTASVKDTFGGKNDKASYIRYFDNLFPQLIPSVFLQLQNLEARDDDELKKFYPAKLHEFNTFLNKPVLRFSSDKLLAEHNNN